MKSLGNCNYAVSLGQVIQYLLWGNCNYVVSLGRLKAGNPVSSFTPFPPPPIKIHWGLNFLNQLCSLAKSCGHNFFYHTVWSDLSERITCHWTAWLASWEKEWWTSVAQLLGLFAPPGLFRGRSWCSSAPHSWQSLGWWCPCLSQTPQT